MTDTSQTLAEFLTQTTSVEADVLQVIVNQTLLEWKMRQARATGALQIESRADPYMPTNEEWETYPWAVAAVTDWLGAMYVFAKEPKLVGENGCAFDLSPNNPDNGICCFVTLTEQPYYINTTLRHRPEGI